MVNKFILQREREEKEVKEDELNQSTDCTASVGISFISLPLLLQPTDRPSSSYTWQKQKQQQYQNWLQKTDRSPGEINPVAETDTFRIFVLLGSLVLITLRPTRLG